MVFHYMQLHVIFSPEKQRSCRTLAKWLFGLLICTSALCLPVQGYNAPYPAHSPREWAVVVTIARTLHLDLTVKPPAALIAMTTSMDEQRTRHYRVRFMNISAGTPACLQALKAKA